MEKQLYRVTATHYDESSEVSDSKEHTWIDFIVLASSYAGAESKVKETIGDKFFRSIDSIEALPQTFIP